MIQFCQRGAEHGAEFHFRSEDFLKFEPSPDVCAFTTPPNRVQNHNVHMVLHIAIARQIVKKGRRNDQHQNFFRALSCPLYEITVPLGVP
jgi:hypothetical protein